jgi:hypothetical protein
MLEHMFEIEGTQGDRQGDRRVERPIDEGLIVALDGVHARISHSQREFLSLIVEVDRSEAWRGSGARDLAHWLSMRYGISQWKARRWIAASQVLDGLPRLADAFARGLLGIDKVVELCRFATSETEVDLFRWAEQVSCASVRHRGDIASRASTEEVVEAERSRTLTWWQLDEGRRVGLEAELPAAQGAVVIRAIERMAERVPQMPDEPDVCFAPARRADALAAICSAHIGSDADPDRATLMIHAHLDSPSGDVGACELEGGPAIHPESAERLRCKRPRADCARGSIGQRDRTRAPVARAVGVDDPPDPLPRSGLPLPGVWHPGIHPSPSHRVVAPRWPNRPGQPVADLLVPPSRGPRAWVVGET